MRNKPGSVPYSSFGILDGSLGSRVVSRPGETRWGQGRSGSHGGLWFPGSFLLPSPSLSWKGATSPSQDTQGHPEATVLWGSGSWGPSALCPSARHMGSEGALSSHLELGHCPLVTCQRSGSGWRPGVCFQNLAL